MDRRQALTRFAGLAAAGLGAGLWRASEDDGSSALAAVESGAVTCVLTPEMTEGPYYVANEKVRRDITEGRPGTPLRLRLSVVNVASCRAIKGAAVDIWHCDAAGLYSAFSVTNNRTFLRGIQRTNANGLAIFDTIYPGWYMGRAVHIHVKVHVSGSVVHTGQFFFPDSLTDAVYRKAPYSSRPNRDVRNADDSIYRNGGKRSTLTVKRSGSGYVGSIVMGVHR